MAATQGQRRWLQHDSVTSAAAWQQRGGGSSATTQHRRQLGGGAAAAAAAASAAVAAAQHCNVGGSLAAAQWWRPWQWRQRDRLTAATAWRQQRQRRQRQQRQRRCTVQRQQTMDGARVRAMAIDVTGQEGGTMRRWREAMQKPASQEVPNRIDEICGHSWITGKTRRKMMRTGKIGDRLGGHLRYRDNSSPC